MFVNVFFLLQPISTYINHQEVPTLTHHHRASMTFSENVTVHPPPLFKPGVFDHITCARGVGNLTTDYSIAEGGGEFEPEMSSYMYVFLKVPL